MAEKEGTKVIPEIPRVDPALVNGFARHEVAKISDGFAKYGTLRPAIKSLALHMHLHGQAITVKCSPGDYHAVELAAEVAQPGDVIVIAGNEEDNLAFLGEYGCALLKSKGVAGVVVDGAVRDKKALIASGMPVYARAISAVKHPHQGKVEINVPVNCGGLLVNPGDIIVGDDDGVLAVPYYDAERALALANEKVAGEERLQKIIDGGAKFTVLAKCDDKIKVWREDEQ